MSLGVHPHLCACHYRQADAAWPRIAGADRLAGPAAGPDATPAAPAAADTEPA
ncbi:hypothetical protein FRACA_20042 [Frankia canadensis]|uniref:Uncharacterized protein n=1 Tax=Frankia canadensis TaxID=1836972 RepID=A0A2I2KPT0_9ACTN|nr:hypothetical protein [Frankia canadensis]SNQ47646.1 hypothetical protein FRACA_20042 [Frankia canadensis]SOU54936.1 hypothetical protein FRACA_20042 [Frankia canadensis]